VTFTSSWSAAFETADEESGAGGTYSASARRKTAQNAASVMMTHPTRAR
jgi:hypothetical protein